MAEITLPRQGVAGNSVVRHFLAPLAIAVTASGFVALCAHASIPLLFTPVPLSLAPFAVLLVGLVLGPRLAFASLSLYLLEGAAGLPVFSPQGLGGVTQLLGPTGGYLLSYPFAATLAGYLYRRGAGTIPRGLIAAGSASVLILIAGASWLKLLTHMDVQLILAQAVVPFLPGDVLKVCAAAGLAKLAGGLRLPGQRNSPHPREEEI